MNHNDSTRALQLAVIQILDAAVGQIEHGQPLYGDWSVQGFGVLRLYIRRIGRLHIWDSQLRYPGVSMIHNHSWDLRSTVVFGELRNTKFLELPADDLRSGSEAYWKHRLLTGYKARVINGSEQVRLHKYPGKVYQPGEQYVQAADEIHLTETLDGTVTLMERNEDTNGEADVYWRVGERWGDATPRRATLDEVRSTILRALRWLEPANQTIRTADWLFAQSTAEVRR